MKADERRRRLVGRSRHPDTPPAVVYEWVPGTPEFRCVADPLEVQFQDNWETLKAIMARRWQPASVGELLDDWPPDQSPPTRMQLYHWLKRAFVNRWVRASRATRTATSSPARTTRPLRSADECEQGSYEVGADSQCHETDHLGPPTKMFPRSFVSLANTAFVTRSGSQQ